MCLVWHSLHIHVEPLLVPRLLLCFSNVLAVLVLQRALWKSDNHGSSLFIPPTVGGSVVLSLRILHKKGWWSQNHSSVVISVFRLLFDHIVHQHSLACSGRRYSPSCGYAFSYTGFNVHFSKSGSKASSVVILGKKWCLFIKTNNTLTEI